MTKHGIERKRIYGFPPKTLRFEILNNFGINMIAKIGAVDRCTISSVSGWFVGVKGKIAIPDISVNGQPVSCVIDRVYRPDLVDAGINPNAGFVFTFNDHLEIGDKVEVSGFGRSLVGSPTSPETDGVRILTEGVSAAESIIRFEGRKPSPQTAVDVFRGRWASNLQPVLGVTGTGSSNLFNEDMRPLQAVKALGRSDLQGLNVLEIGPLEGAHTVALEKMGASSVTAVESSVEAWLKCLIVKELMGLKSRFELGDAVSYLRAADTNFDFVFCSGVLYHMSDPISLIEAVSERSNACFFWTHIYDPDDHPKEFKGIVRIKEGLDVTYWSHDYGNRSSAFWGGIASNACWLTKKDLIRALVHVGFSDIQIIEEISAVGSAPSISLLAQRPPNL